ncbi:MAG: hypothetical protein HPKKFMNG_02610 [Planctomycetes bacterium]|nr:hypothetical protein [Planctomycetota bacterium]
MILYKNLIEYSMGAIMIILEILAVILVADFFAGFIHWAEDAYAREDMPIIGPFVAAPNVLHHKQPRAFLKKNWLQSSWDLLLGGALLVGTAAALGVLTWHVWLFAALVVMSNQVHKWSHQGPREHWRVITWLQKARVLQTPRQHAQHHRGERNTHYCVITNVLNPVLDRIGFWKGLEWCIERTLGVKRRVEVVSPA